jgi:hypothetical protein
MIIPKNIATNLEYDVVALDSTVGLTPANRSYRGLYSRRRVKPVAMGGSMRYTINDGALFDRLTHRRIPLERLTVQGDFVLDSGILIWKRDIEGWNENQD